jgi:CBS domain-containing protein
MAQKLKDLMTPNPVTCPKDASLADVAQIMKDRDIGNVLVMNGDSIMGIATDRDIVVRGLADGRDATSPISEVCSTDLVSLSPDDDIDTALNTMRERAVRRLPVVDNGRPVGIVSLGDLADERNADDTLADISAAPPND